MSRNSIFKSVGSLHLRKHKYNLNYHKYFDCEAGQLIPVAFEECVPGDTVYLGQEALIRMQPLIKPIFGKLQYHTYSFFIPTAILFGEYKTDGEGTHYWDPDRKQFELFLGRGKDGKDKSISLPYWVPTGSNVTNDAYYEWVVNPDTEEEETKSIGIVKDNGVGSLWDYFGLPIGVIPKVTIKDEDGNEVEMDAVLDFPRRAYNIVYGEFFRDETLMDYPDPESSIVRNKCWKKDLFTSSLPWQQRGIQPALPVDLTGNLFVQYFDSNHATGLNNSVGLSKEGAGDFPNVIDSSSQAVYGGSGYYTYAFGKTADDIKPLYVDSSNIKATTFDVSDLRAAFQVQKWLERSARGGYRMKEILLSHFGVAPSDETLMRPAFIGHTSTPIIISEVLQTSESAEGSPQGNLSGHGISAGRSYIGKWKAKEFGYILTLACIVPDTSYSQGINKQFSKFSRWDYMWPETMFLSEEAVRTMEVYTDENADADDNATIFGYQSRFYELRSRQNMFCGSFRSDLNFWHMGREFEDTPLLNDSFVKMVPTKRIFASLEEPGFLVDHFNIHKWYRPIPHNLEPGLIDHM